MKRIIYIVLCAFILISCQRPAWVRELENKNPLKSNDNYTSVYFRFDTIINDFEVSGIIYPTYFEGYGWDANESGVRLFFHSLKSGKEYIWSDWDEESQAFRTLFMSKNVKDIVYNDSFRGFNSGDFYVFHYDTSHYNDSDNDLLPNAEYQFYDIDFDGEDELLLGYYTGGPKGSPWYQVYEITDSALVEKLPIGEDNVWGLDMNTTIDAANKTIINILYGGCCEWGTYAFKADDEGNFHQLYYANTIYRQIEDTIISDTTYFSL